MVFRCHETFDVSGKCDIQLCQIHNFPLNRGSFGVEYGFNTRKIVAYMYA